MKESAIITNNVESINGGRMVSSISNSSGQNAVADILKQQNKQVEEQRTKASDEQRRQEQLKAEQAAKAEQTKQAIDESRGNNINISV
ncbi:hypothetical protein [Litorilituus lipolyticus]|uniref:Uncharacterized protein n=1 Tax=Litorilituus lipolyticus TaxID=2491017 RepID=A0A502KUE0_9GAMM|nr:hypothetical protein [Litorilituus lipolyticus]TPH14049.1 hypothetical protein EPA86_13160 [Litorilituus lipolyticus]